MATIRFTIIYICMASVVGYATSDTYDQQYVAKACNQKLKNIDSIATFKEFMRQYRPFAQTYGAPSGGALNLEKPLSNCLNLKEALFELERLIDTRHNGVCRMNYVNELIDFKVKYILHSGERNENKNLDKIDSNASYIAFFFTIYAYQVAFYCKSQIHIKLEDAQRKQDCAKILTEMIPVTSPHGDGVTDSDEVNIVATLLDESKVENFVPILHLRQLHLPVANIDVMVPNSAMDRIATLKEECKRIEPYYMASLSPTGALAQFGYEVDSKLISDYSDHQSEDLLKCWLGAAQLCQGILRTHLTVSDRFEIDPDATSKFVTVELQGSPNESSSESNVLNDDVTHEGDSFEEIDPIAIILAKKRLTLSSKMKWKVSNLVKNFVERRIDIKATQESALRGLLDSIKSMDNDIDKKVSFAGREIKSKAFNPVGLVTDNADSIIRTASPFFNKEIGFIMSCVVGIVMTAVFAYLTVYILASTLKHKRYTPGDFSRDDWRKLREKKMAKVRSNLEGGKRNMLGMRVYKP